MKAKDFKLQPLVLENERVYIRPLQENDFEELYHLAADPLVWEMHPEKERYKREVFEGFFKNAIASKGAFLLYSKSNMQIIGTSRYYDLSPETSSVAVGYTFYGREFWGGHYNSAVKNLMLTHAFQFVDTVIFHIGAFNLRSRKAVEKLGGKLVQPGEQFYPETDSDTKVVYTLREEDYSQSSYK